MTEFGEQVGETRIGSLHDSVTLEDGRTVAVGDVVGYDVKDLNPYKDHRKDPVKSMEVLTGTVEKIWNHDGKAEVSVTNDHVGRIDAEDLQETPERFDRFRSEIPEGEGCIIESWYAAYSEVAHDKMTDEYTLEANPA